MKKTNHTPTTFIINSANKVFSIKRKSSNIPNSLALPGGSTHSYLSEHENYLVRELLEENALIEDDSYAYVEAKKGRIDNLEEFFKDNVNKTELNYVRVLYGYAKGGNIKIIDFLKKEGFFLQNTARNVLIAINKLCENGNYEGIKHILSCYTPNRLNLNESYENLLSSCVGAPKNNIKMINLLVENDINLERYGKQALIQTIYREDKKLLIFMYNLYRKDDADVLRYALNRDNLDIIKVLEEQGANLAVDDGALLYASILYKNMQAINYLLEKGVRVEESKIINEIYLPEIEKNYVLDYQRSHERYTVLQTELLANKKSNKKLKI